MTRKKTVQKVRFETIATCETDFFPATITYSMVAGKKSVSQVAMVSNLTFCGLKDPCSSVSQQKAKCIDVDWAVPAVTTDLVGDVVQPPGSPGCSSPLLQKKTSFLRSRKDPVVFLIAVSRPFGFIVPYVRCNKQRFLHNLGVDLAFLDKKPS